MPLVFAAGPEDTGPIVELAAKGPVLKNLTLLHLAPSTAAKQLSGAPANDVVIATICLAQKTGEFVRFPYNSAFFSKFHPDAFLVIEAEGDDPLQQRVNLHMALSANPDAVKVIKVDRGNIKQAVVEIRKALAEVAV